MVTLSLSGLCLVQCKQMACLADTSGVMLSHSEGKFL